VLTVRDEAKWLESVRRHWDHKSNPFRKQWDHDPFSHQIHKIIYGRRDFDADTMLARYKRHSDEVWEYFEGRPDDLLVLNVDDGDGWLELCRFLGREVPTGVAYPVENRAGG
jgi:hypothetical protein